MTHPTNWPNPERPGVPMFPERDGWHWLSLGDASPIPVEWNADHAPVAFDNWGWALGDYDDDLHSPEKVAKSMRYHGPCLTPTQIAELLAEERERCAKECDEKVAFANDELKASGSHEETRYWTGEHCAATFCADAIRGLGGKV